MAGKIPSFISGASAKIKAGGLTFAYAQDVSCQIRVDTIPVETMGRFEVVSNEPVDYKVGGDLSIVRYTKVAKANNMAGASTNGNGLGNANFTTGGKGSDHIDPGNLLMSQTWDLAIFQKIQTAPGAPATTPNAPFLTVTDCRFTSKGSGLSKRGILVDRMSFVGVLASDDSFTATHSGDEDLSA